MSRRRLRPEERALWEQVARTARARPGRAPSANPLEAPAPAPLTDTAQAGTKRAQAAAIPNGFAIGRDAGATQSHDLARPIAEALRGAPVAMDRRQFLRLSRGKLVPEGRIDLHGMTLAQAHGALTGFIADAWTRGLRLVLVITGKGRGGADRGGAGHGPIPQRTGALRHEVPAWLRRAPLAPMILEVRPAHRRHGGEGALYVYLRRRR